MNFRTWLEAAWSDRSRVDEPFDVGGKPYVLRFSLIPTSRFFPYSPYGGGSVAEIVWFPAERGGIEDKWSRTGDNSLGQVRQILSTLPPMISQWVAMNKPVGFYWKGDDARLASVWNRMSRGADFASLGYVRSRTKPNVYVQQRLQQMLDTMSDVG